MKYPLYQKAKELLFAEYHKNFEIVKDSPYHRRYVDEKIRHSLQVSGAGNGILKHEAFFRNRPDEFTDIARTAILLHDIFRFSEVRILYETGNKIDHGVMGAEFLKQIPEFNNILITLPIKHHGHMIERLYEDEEYQSIADEQTKENIRYIAFAVRDADKIANWKIVTNEFEFVKKVWLPFPEDDSEKQRIISPEVWVYFLRQEVIPHEILKNPTNAAELLSTLCWLFDMNYPYSIYYCRRLNLFAKFLRLFEQLKLQQDKVSVIGDVIKSFCRQRFNSDI